MITFEPFERIPLVNEMLKRTEISKLTEDTYQNTTTRIGFLQRREEATGRGLKTAKYRQSMKMRKSKAK